METKLIHQRQRQRQTRHLPAGKHILDGQVLSRDLLHVCRSRQDTDTTRLKCRGYAFNPVTLAVYASVLVDTNRDVLVISIGLSFELSVILLDDLDPIRKAPFDETLLHDSVLFRHQPVVDHTGTILFRCQHRHITPARAHLDHSVAGLEPQFATKVVASFVLRLVQGLCAFWPVALSVADGLPEQGLKQSQWQPVMRFSIGLGARVSAIALTTFEPPSAETD